MDTAPAAPTAAADPAAGTDPSAATDPAPAAEAGPTLSRRALLAAGAATGAAGVLVLAGCSKGSSGATGAAGASASGSGGAGAGGSAGTVLAKVSQVPVGNALSATMDGEPVLISQPTAGTIVTFSAICTHQGCTVAPAGKQFHCPCHGSVYDAATGAVIEGPAPAPLKKIATHVADGEVIAGA